MTCLLAVVVPLVEGICTAAPPVPLPNPVVCVLKGNVLHIVS